jgi:hypothetical protein
MRPGMAPAAGLRLAIMLVHHRKHKGGELPLAPLHTDSKTPQPMVFNSWPTPGTPNSSPTPGAPKEAEAKPETEGPVAQEEPAALSAQMQQD